MKAALMCLVPLLAAAAPAQTIEIREGLAVRVPGNRRSPVRVDPIEAKLAAGTWKAPQAGEGIGNGTWAPIQAGADGRFTGPMVQGGYVFATVDSPKAQTMLLEASGHALVYVNGELRGGDPYATGYVVVPVQLKPGKNEFLFTAGRGQLQARLVTPPANQVLDARDATLPDLYPGAPATLWGAIPVVNTVNAWREDLSIEVPTARGFLRTKLPRIGPYTTRKVPFQISSTGPAKLQIRLKQGHQTIHTLTIELRKRQAGESTKRTFVSEVDGSVQYYAVQPSLADGPGQALFLSVHGASVEAIGQADAYSRKTWGHLVAPTNRRPFGFDWEDIGRQDALEVMNLARTTLQTDPTKTYLTGHSMGGHGTWILGFQFPDRFGAIAPCAGWQSFATYGGGLPVSGDSPMEQMIRRAWNQSDTLLLKSNAQKMGIFVLHGDADTTVPVSEPRAMREALKGHPDLHFFEEPGQGHWYDTDPEPGANCVDFMPIFELFARRKAPTAETVRQVDFTTVSPNVSAICHWVRVDQQLRPLMPSRVQLQIDPLSRRVFGTTDNVRRMTLGHSQLIGNVTLELDGQKLTFQRPKAGSFTVVKASSTWTLETDANWWQREKTSQQGGNFKEIFRNRIAFVYGTGGSPEERAWAYAKARFDAETYWVRGNGSVDIYPDTVSLTELAGRNVLLYGAADQNQLWAKLVSSSEIRAQRGQVRIGDQTRNGEDLGLVAWFKRKDDPARSVGVLAPTGPAGRAVLDRIPLFTAGAHFPEVSVLSSKMLSEGVAGVVAMGYTGADGKVSSGEFEWQSAP